MAAWVKELTEHAIMTATNLTARFMSSELACERIVEKKLRNEQEKPDSSLRRAQWVILAGVQRTRMSISL